MLRVQEESVLTRISDCRESRNREMETITY
jgi:hypothetical protein